MFALYRDMFTSHYLNLACFILFHMQQSILVTTMTTMTTINECHKILRQLETCVDTLAEQQKKCQQFGRKLQSQKAITDYLLSEYMSIKRTEIESEKLKTTQERLTEATLLLSIYHMDFVQNLKSFANLNIRKERLSKKFDFLLSIIESKNHYNNRK